MKVKARKLPFSSLLLLALAVAAPASAAPDDQGLAAASAGETSNRLATWYSGPIESVARRLLWLRFIGGPYAESLVRLPAAEGSQLSSEFDAADRHWARLEVLYARLADVPGFLDAQHARAEIAFFRGEYDHALVFKQRELDVASRNGVAWGEARAESGLGVILRRRGRLDQAMAHFERALTLRRALGDRYGEADTLVQLASAHRNLGDYSRALGLLLQSVEIRHALGEFSRLDLSYRALGVLYRESEDHAKATDAFEQALTYAEPLGDPLALSPILGSLAALYNDRLEPNQALSMARRAQGIDREFGNRSGIAQGSLEAGRALIELRSFDDATVELERAQQLAETMQQTFLAARARLYLALIAEQRDDAARALELLDAATREFSSEDARPLMLQALGAQERIRTARGEWQEALALAQRRAALREELLGVQSGRRLAALAAEFEQQQQKQQIALLTKGNEIQALQLEQERLRRWLGLSALAALSGWALWLARRYHTSKRLNAELRLRNVQIAEQRERLEEVNARLELQAVDLYRAAITDPLTGVLNRRHLLHLIREGLDRARAEGTELAVLMTDFDLFKAINDTHGHLFGDRVLAAGVEHMRQSLRGSDFVGRYGGEELLIVLPNTDLTTALAIAERVRQRIAEALALIDGIRVGLTVSIGVAVLSRCTAPTVEALLNAADLALYRAKAAGRNRVAEGAARLRDEAAVSGG